MSLKNFPIPSSSALEKLSFDFFNWLFIFLSIYFNWRIIILHTVFSIHQHVWFLPYIDMNQPWVHMCLPIPLGCPRAPTLSALLHALNLHWSSILHMVIYMFHCWSLRSYHSVGLLPQSPKVRSLHLWLFTSVALSILHIGRLFPSF